MSIVGNGYCRPCLQACRSLAEAVLHISRLAHSYWATAEAGTWLAFAACEYSSLTRACVLTRTPCRALCIQRAHNWPLLYCWARGKGPKRKKRDTQPRVLPATHRAPGLSTALDCCLLMMWLLYGHALQVAGVSSGSLGPGRRCQLGRSPARFSGRWRAIHSHLRLHAHEHQRVVCPGLRAGGSGALHTAPEPHLLAHTVPCACVSGMRDCPVHSQNWGRLSGQALADKQAGFLAAMRGSLSQYLTINETRISFYTNVTTSPLPNDPRSYVRLVVQYPGDRGGLWPTGYYIDIVS